MKKVQVFDPPMCCSTGVCGPNVDPALARFSSDLHWHAPTGHTILLLDAAEAYHRDVTRTMSDVPDAVRQLLLRLRNPDFTHVLLVTLPEATPVHEAARLQDDVRRAGIKPYASIINQSFAGEGFRDPVLVERGSREAQYIAEVRDRLATRFTVIPWKPAARVGPDLLRELAGDSLAFAGTSKG